MPYRTIVVGTDGSARAHGAVREAAALAATAGARLVLVTAHEPDDAAGDDDARLIATGAGATDVEQLGVEGAPADVLLRVVAERDADLLVVGSKGMTDASRFVIGSVANTLSHHATCDVLIVQTRESD